MQLMAISDIRPFASRFGRQLLQYVLLGMLLLGAATVRAELLDEVRVNRAGETAALEIQFQRPIVYQRHTPADEGDLVQVYFQSLGQEHDERVREEFRRIVDEAGIPDTTVTYHGRDRLNVHRLTIAFARSQRFELRPGPDQRSLVIRLVASARDEATRWRVRLSTTGSAPPMPTALQSLPLRNVTQANGEQWLTLGEFTDKTQAAAILQQVQAIQPDAVLLQRDAAGNWSALSSADSATGVLLQEPVEALDNEAAVERYAAQLMQSALTLLTAGDSTEALNALNRLLNLPPNKQSADAQELIGVTRERLGDFERARIEYELYLKLYPDSERRARVEERLRKVQAQPQQVAEIPEAAAAEHDFYGSFLQTWFEGNSKVESETIDPFGGLPDRSSLSFQDQRSLLSSIDLTFRRRSEGSEQRWVLRNAYIASYLDDVDDRNRLYAAYWDYRDRNQGWSMRVGRQNSQVGGVLGRFDGLQANYDGFTDQRYGFVTGQVVDTARVEEARFVSLFAEQSLLDRKLKNQVYTLRNERGGVISRQAVGDVLSYVGDSSTWFGMLDYDTLFAELNIASLQGSWQYLPGGYFNWMLDRRKTPPLDLGNALIGEPIQPLAELVALLGEEAAMKQARDRTADADGISLSLTYPLKEDWQLGVDVRGYEVSALPASGSLPASPGTGQVLTLGTQLIGNQLLAERDANIWSINLIQGDRYTGWSLAYTLLWPATDNLTVEPTLRYYQQDDESGLTLSRWTPTLRLRYQISSRMLLELQYDGERSLTETDTLTDQLDRQLWSVGYVWEF